jgi:hypothetical protein
MAQQVRSFPASLSGRDSMCNGFILGFERCLYDRLRDVIANTCVSARRPSDRRGRHPRFWEKGVVTTPTDRAGEHIAKILHVEPYRGVLLAGLDHHSHQSTRRMRSDSEPKTPLPARIQRATTMASCPIACSKQLSRAGPMRARNTSCHRTTRRQAKWANIAQLHGSRQSSCLILTGPASENVRLRRADGEVSVEGEFPEVYWIP